MVVAFILSLTLGTVLPLSVVAQANTLVWGVQVGEESTYLFQRVFFSDPSYVDVVEPDLPFIRELPVGEKAIMNVSTLDTIPALINDTSQMPLAHCDLIRANDSLSIASDLKFFVIPIGDWNFLTEIQNVTGSSEVQIIDTADEWGTIGTGSFQASDGSVISVYFEMRYDKQNGTLSYLRHKYSTLGTDLIDVVFVNWHEGMPTVVGPDVQLSTIFVIAIGGVVGIIIGIIVYQRIKEKKPLVQRLGE